MKSDWTITYKDFNTKDHSLQEALCTLGNGYFTTRGALEMEKNQHPKNIVGKNKVSPGKYWNYPGTYLAGGYNRMKSKVQDKIIENEDLVNWPNWLYLTFRIEDDNWFDMDATEIISYETHLHLKEAILERKLSFRDKKGRVSELKSRRLVSMSNPHAAAIQWELIPLNWSGKITLRSGIDGNIINNNVERYSALNQNHIDIIDTGHFNDSSIYMLSQSNQSKILTAQAAKTTIFFKGKSTETFINEVNEDGLVAMDFIFNCQEGETCQVEKIMSFFSSRDMAISDPLTEARKSIDRADTFGTLEEKHTAAWRHIWQYNDIELETSEPLDQKVIRLHILHLYQTVSLNSVDYDIGIPARGWHGEAYRGHIFWDELYIKPFIDLHFPQLSRSLLMYRYRRLPEARFAAFQSGYRGAMFPWQSGSNGREETQKIHLNPRSGRWLPDVSHLQYHINAAVPYNVWHYYQSTGDIDFLLSHGAEIILSNALFWSDKATFNEKMGKYEIKKVMGPDEYHTHYPGAAEDEPGLNNNAYTNVMAVWVIERALELLELLDNEWRKNLRQTVGFSEIDIDRWKKITKNMYVPFKDDLIMQFDGYDKLKELDWDYYHREYGQFIRLDRVLEAEGDSCNNYKASKQADVLMLFYLFSAEELDGIFNNLGYTLKPGTIPENIDYYSRHTAHGSTLSQVIYAWVFARSNRDESWKSFRKALLSDFKDVQGGTTHEGIHLGAMAGTLDIIQRCYTGLEIRDDVLWFNPQLPEDIRQMRFYLRYRGHWIHLDINHKTLTITFDKGWANPVTIGVNGTTYLFETNDKKIFQL
ncbi:MAG TPA: glycosyl hydrolase family 65 protein [Bacteroidales bacterium]|nr:glycosyl hydrolase family 65 protein [Bacteroidales bacterium]